MAEDVNAEIKALQAEYNWLLTEEVHSVLQQLRATLSEGCRKFPVQINTEDDSVAKSEKFLLSNSNGSSTVKCMITLMADNICEADLTLKIKKQQTSIMNTKIYPDSPWRVQQIQDAGNHLLHALARVEEYDTDHRFRSAQEVLKLLEAITLSLHRGQTCLALPKKRTLEDLVRNPALKSFKPQLPTNTVVSFYVQAQKLILAVYFLYVNNAQKIDIQSRHQVECSVPWLNDALVLFTLAQQQCQQLREKLTVFMQYEAEAKFQEHQARLTLDATTATRQGSESLSGGSWQNANGTAHGPVFDSNHDPLPNSQGLGPRGPAGELLGGGLPGNPPPTRNTYPDGPGLTTAKKSSNLDLLLDSTTSELLTNNKALPNPLIDFR